MAGVARVSIWGKIEQRDGELETRVVDGGERGTYRLQRAAASILARPVAEELPPSCLPGWTKTMAPSPA
jgi:hypothetical protein